MTRGIFGDDARFRSTYWERFPGVYFAGDGARIDEDGDFWLLGRVDDVMNVSGHRLSTIELESTLVEHPAVAEAAATAAPDPLTGQTPLCFVLLRGGHEASEQLESELREWIGTKIGKIARPKAVIIVDDLPKTRSGKIMRRLLRDIAEGHSLGDTTTLRDPAVVEDLKTRADAVLGHAG
jgi:acetyl-CoA synthetase